MGKATAEVSITIRAPIARVFERLSDHEGMAKWPGIDAARLVKDGAPTRNGLGAVRRVKTNGLTLDEEVVRFDAPTAYDYTIIRGLPVDHLGKVRFTESGDAVHVTWSVRLASRIPFVAQLTALGLRRGLPKALAYLKRELESEAR